MTLQTIRDLLHGTQPFAPRMISGRVIRIPHPDFVALSPSQTSLLLALEGDRIEIVRINQIESIDSPAAAENV